MKTTPPLALLAALALLLTGCAADSAHDPGDPQNVASATPTSEPTPSDWELEDLGFEAGASLPAALEPFIVDTLSEEGDWVPIPPELDDGTSHQHEETGCVVSHASYAQREPSNSGDAQASLDFLSRHLGQDAGAAAHGPLPFTLIGEEIGKSAQIEFLAVTADDANGGEHLLAARTLERLGISFLLTISCGAPDDAPVIYGDALRRIGFGLMPSSPRD